MKKIRNSKFEIRVWFPTLLLLAAAATAGQTGQVVVRTTALPEKKIWVGQRVVLQIDVLASDGWAQARLPELDVDGAYVLPKESQGVRLNETIAGVSYSGQRYEALIYPQRGGALRIPAIPLRLEIKTFGAQATTETRSATTEPLDRMVAVPPGAEGLRGLITTTDLEATQTWQPADADFSVGDAIKRTVTLSATDVSGMVFTPHEPAAIAGVAIYPSQPTVQDRDDRGALSGRRIEVVTYVFEQAGDVHLPGRSVSWWNPEHEVMQMTEVPGLDLKIAPPPLGSRVAAGVVPIALLAGFATLFSAIVIWWRWGRLRERYVLWKVERETSERALFHRFDGAARSGEAGPTLNALMVWLDRTQPAPAGVQKFAAEFGDVEVASRSEQLLRAASGKDAGDFDGEALRHAIAAARRRWREQRKSDARPDVLPPLNPGIRSERGAG